MNTRCSMCQSCGWAAIPVSKTRATCWVMAAIFSRLVPPSGTGISSWMCVYHSGPSNHRVTGMSAAPVCTASAAAPPIMCAFSPKKSTSIPPPVTSRSAGRHTRPPARSRCARMPNRCTPPVAGSTSKPSPSRKAKKRRASDSGLSRSATVVSLGTPRPMIQAPA